MAEIDCRLCNPKEPHERITIAESVAYLRGGSPPADVCQKHLEQSLGEYASLVYSSKSPVIDAVKREVILSPADPPTRWRSFAELADLIEATSESKP